MLNIVVIHYSFLVNTVTSNAT